MVSSSSPSSSSSSSSSSKCHHKCKAVPWIKCKELIQAVPCWVFAWSVIIHACLRLVCCPRRNLLNQMSEGLSSQTWIYSIQYINGAFWGTRFRVPCVLQRRDAVPSLRRLDDRRAGSTAWIAQAPSADDERNLHSLAGHRDRTRRCCTCGVVTKPRVNLHIPKIVIVFSYYRFCG